MTLILIAALDACRAIGVDNQLPWHLPDDLKFFKAQTQGGVVVMGRKTFESLGSRPLPNRRNIVLTRQLGWAHQGVEVAHDWSHLKASLVEQAVARVWVIGGGELYQLALPEADALVITQVETQLSDADTWFPDWSAQGWFLVQSERHPQDARHPFAFTWQAWLKHPEDILTLNSIA